LVRLCIWSVHWFSNQINFRLVKDYLLQTPVVQTHKNIQTRCNTKLIYFRVNSVLVRLSTWSVYWFSNQINFISQTPVIQTRKNIQTRYNTKLLSLEVWFDCFLKDFQINFRPVKDYLFQTRLIQTRKNIQTPCNTKLIYFRASSVLVRPFTWSVHWFSNQINFISQTPIIQTRIDIQTPCNTKLIYFRTIQVLVRLSTWNVHWFPNQINFIFQTLVIQTLINIQTRYITWQRITYKIDLLSNNSSFGSTVYLKCALIFKSNQFSITNSYNSNSY